MLLSKSSCVCIPCFKSVAQMALAKALFLAFLRPDMNIEMSAVIYLYLKHSTNYIDSKYIWVHMSNYIGSSVSAEISFLAF